ncbi:hypothetical protein SAMN02745704_02619 [Paucidesulfovibrio gracilis DSM 16080]|uniref:Uncharacterized protein n=1 Tax=Paucidesulfovibrio gracilis DSM 16080 TaxID=1121449 RepID=A0A1T4XZ70_9BACT|nr:hypothetical protein [Paucidesulfovibrio gracilis]SKA94806.1 hypothetical protein SAMN02745704_02619 [Paucidesulfovibrio gracilis DSM 16080]
MKKKIVLAASFFVALWFGGMLHAWLFTPDVGVVLLSNESSETIASIQVSVCGQLFNFPDVSEQKYVLARYGVTSDSHYEIKARFLSGRTVEGEIGYVTNGNDFFDVIEITDNKIIHAERVLPHSQ